MNSYDKNEAIKMMYARKAILLASAKADEEVSVTMSVPTYQEFEYILNGFKVSITLEEIRS